MRVIQMTQDKITDRVPEVAFYYPGQYWWDTDWVKNLILFFDGIAMLIPEHMRDYGGYEDRPVIAALKEHDLFHIVRPEEQVGKAETELLAENLIDIIASGHLDHLTRNRGTRDSAFGSLSMSRLGFMGDEKLAEFMLKELKDRGLAADSEDGVTIPIDRTVRTLILVLLSQILKSSGDRMGIELSPATDRLDVIEALDEIISGPDSLAQSVGEIVSFDMAMVGVDLSSVPMDEILDFREQHYKQHRNYRLDVRRFARELCLMPEDERRDTFERRQDELDSAARELKRMSREAWRKPISFAFGLAGVMSTLLGNPIAAAIAASGAAVSSMSSAGPNDIGVYSYLFSARRELY